MSFPPADCGGTLVLVSQDGIQRPPLHFPPGGHLLAFLSCLETGLLPRGQLEPPLWSQKGKVSHPQLGVTLKFDVLNVLKLYCLS